MPLKKDMEIISTCIQKRKILSRIWFKDRRQNVLARLLRRLPSCVIQLVIHKINLHAFCGYLTSHSLSVRVIFAGRVFQLFQRIDAHSLLCNCCCKFLCSWRSSSRRSALNSHLIAFQLNNLSSIEHLGYTLFLFLRVFSSFTYDMTVNVILQISH